MGLDIIGAGFGRTGTKSLQDALGILGYPTYHMVEVMKHPDHIQLWLDAHAGKPDWDAIFSGYTATLDWPGCDYALDLLKANPDAKVILNVRDADKWWESVNATIYKMSQISDEKLAKYGPLLPMQSMIRKTVWGNEGSFKGRFPDREFAKKVFTDHIETIKRSVPADNLLVFEISQGWEPICRFLGKPVPQETFPHTNETKSMAGLIEAIEN
ncbi:hypothetical protein HKX48_001745, partial [Thoreauomyces humboldtii]